MSKRQTILCLVWISILSLLLSSCATQPQGPSFYEESEAMRKRWLAQLEITIGTHISTLIDIWGKPEKSGKPGAYEYRWSSRKEFSSGGYYVEGRTEQRIYNKYGRFKGTIETPTKDYVAPVTDVAWCKLRINTDKEWITHVGVESGFGDTITPYKDGSICYRHFPFP